MYKRDVYIDIANKYMYTESVLCQLMSPNLSFSGYIEQIIKQLHDCSWR